MDCTKFGLLAFALLAMMTIPAMAAAAGRHPLFEVTGVVVKNHDGDTLKLQTEERGLLTIRLSGVDTPETGQAYWRVARGYLRKITAGKPTTALCYKTDPRGREVCHVSVGGQDVSEALIAGGYGWYARMFANELSEAQQRANDEAEKSARGERLGLWQDEEPMPPWECRKRRKAGLACH